MTQSRKPSKRTNRTARAVPLDVSARAEHDSIVARPRGFKMTHDVQQSLTPRLRFPEFRKETSWATGEVRDLATVLSGYGFPEKHQGQPAGDFPFYKVSDISRSVEQGNAIITDATNYVDREILKVLRATPLPAGSTIFAKIGEAIRSNRRVVTGQPSLVDNNVAGLKAIDGQSIDTFVYYLFSTIALGQYAGGVVPAINKSAIECIPVSYPSIAEQRKIAGCLTSLDELIAVQGRKVEALKVHKKGLMQQLFPREGEKPPSPPLPRLSQRAELDSKEDRRDAR